MALRAGAAQVEITPQAGVELMGYGARSGRSTGTHDPLFARALHMATDTGSVLLLSADLCLIGPQQAEEVRARIAERTRIAPDRVLVGCTHTHSGPDTGLGQLSAGEAPAPHCAALFQGLVDVGVMAITCAEPARLRWSRAEARIGRNRRIADGPLDPQVLVLRVDTAGGRPLAIAFSHGCHGTVLGHDNLEVSADWPGVAAAHIAAETGALALFLLGAHADIDPRTRGLMDLAIPGQSVGLGFEAVRVLGLEVAEAALGALDRAADAEGPVAAASTRVRLPVHLGGSEADARQELEQRKLALADLLELPPAEFPRLSALSAVAERQARSLPLDEARRLISRARLYVRDKTAPFFAGGREVDVEVQVLRLGDTALLGVPLEPTTNVGLDWQERTRGVARHAGVLGIANGWLRYLPHARDLAHPHAGEHYEVLMSTFAAQACDELLAAGERLLADLT